MGSPADEPEHQKTLNALVRALGNPRVHVHLTIFCSSLPSPSKPARSSYSILHPQPDAVLYRVPEGIVDTDQSTIMQDHTGVHVPLVLVEESQSPELAMYTSLLDSKLFPVLNKLEVDRKEALDDCVL